MLGGTFSSEFWKGSILIPSVLVNWRLSFFFLNFKGTPRQEEHNTLFSGLSEIIDVWSKWRYSFFFFNSPLHSLWHLHLHWLSAVCQFRKVNFLKHCGIGHLTGQRGQRIIVSGINEIPVSHILDSVADPDPFPRVSRIRIRKLL